LSHAGSEPVQQREQHRAGWHWPSCNS
jgi:hypothetical protein